MQKIKVEISWLDNYGASCELLAGCIVTHENLEELKTNFESALEFHLESMKEDGNKIPKELLEDYEFEYVLNTHALLNYFKPYISRAALSRASGINERQLGHYIQGKSEAKPEQRAKIIEALHKIGNKLISVV